MKTVAILQCRLTSSRFPRKILEKIEGKTMLQRIIDEVNKCKLVHQLVVAIPKGQNIPFESAKKFEGSEEDVLDRYYQCAKKYEADTIVRITADCPLLHSFMIDNAIQTYILWKTPYIFYCALDGFDVEVFSFRLLEEAFQNAADPYDREHVTSYMKKVTKLSVDTPEDLERVKQWISGKRL